MKRKKKKVSNNKNILSKIKDTFKIKNIKKETVKLFKRIKKKASKDNCLFITFVFITFGLMDIAIRILAKKIEFFPVYYLTGRLFSITYIVLLLGVIFSIKRNYGKYVYVITFIIFMLLYFIHNIYFGISSNFFSFSILGLASEGSTYFGDAIAKSSIWIYVIALVIIASFIISLKFFPKNTEFRKKRLVIFIIVFLMMHFGTKLTLGKANVELTWNTWKNPRNVYNNFNDVNKDLALTGLYEYTFRDFYINYIKPEAKLSETENSFLEDVFSEENDRYYKNKYTGRYKNYNVIFLQLEGIDDWLLTKETMPNAYSLLSHSIAFKDHYAFNNGGGSTFNSEFMVNVGYMTPFNYPINAYTLNKNDFPYSMANLMKAKDYNVKVFHMNSGEYYSRAINYSNWGYDQYFSLKDSGRYENNEYQLDRYLIEDEEFYKEMFNNTGHFVNYIITYSNHMPFTATHSVCRQLLSLDYEDKIKDMNYNEKTAFFESLNLTEEDCIKRQAQETDYMIGLLLKALKKEGLYDKTMIVAYADHYLYTASDEVLSSHKDITTNLVNHTPFYIWTSKGKKEEITKATSQLNILPTVLNLLGVSYNQKWYVQQDALDSSYTPMVIFSDLSWYDGKYYVVDGICKNRVIDESVNEQKHSYVEYLVKKNDLVLKYNYFKELMS